MTFGLSSVCFLVAVVLFVVSAFPPVPYNSALARIGLAFVALGLLLAGAG